MNEQPQAWYAIDAGDYDLYICTDELAMLEVLEGLDPFQPVWHWVPPTQRVPYAREAA